MLLKFDNGEPFAIGSVPYIYRPVTEAEKSNRIILNIIIGDVETGILTTGFVDTGGVFLVCSPEIASQLNLDPSQGIPTSDLRWRERKMQGTLYRVPLTLLADEGEDLTIEATTFVPLVDMENFNNFPCILGMSNCLERLRFAVDPTNNTFYFGQMA